mmetsp:Transcript_132389/g.264085  ORF Transcript_132389/g.264085 Transcript_132389/m.264085 type:complete len:331 (+) Transcript_132389:144-1136(+)|eukprot:CAMPEP_0172670588 /NCGR_PEP_ID=MMETSP1074-20121228/10390_1 /TAXON_ID=2916 /ORGANISM="Ceratium fusus, Strain PA161109" /LENGTH=330 /DNA_ID=CAMNT_0013487517 /DNA_START=139 /DNA_END=1131 /DNA_ORIENTATION=+
MNAQKGGIYFGGGSNSLPGAGGDFAGRFSGAGFVLRRRRLNLVPICLGLFLPWVIFCLTLTMLSFWMQYKFPGLCLMVVIAIACVGGLICMQSAYTLIRMLTNDSVSEEPDREGPSWMLFISASVLVALLCAVCLGTRNFWNNMQPYYDVKGLGTYVGVDPSKMRGQELMDAGQVTFKGGSRLDLARSVGFRNEDLFCVAPITSRIVAGSRTPLESYDFWAVGKNCCSGNVADFRCGQYSSKRAHAGVRMVRDDDRAFYRLAVQQAQSAFNIKAVHPLFFHWVEEPNAEIEGYRLNGYRFVLIGIFGYFTFQLFFVMLIALFLSRKKLTP